MTNREKFALALYCQAIVETVVECEGAPAGHLFLAFMDTTDAMTFGAWLSMLVDVGALKRQGRDFYVAGDKAQAFIDGVNAMKAKVDAAKAAQGGVQ